MSMANGILKGAQIFSTFHDMFQQGQQQREIDKITNEKTVESTGYTADQGKELEKLATEGYKIDFDQNKNSYVATNEAGDTKSIAMQGVTDFMGSRTAGSMDQQQQDNQRYMAMAGVIGRTDPVRGAQMRRQVQQDVHAGKRMEREEKQWAKEDGIESIDKELGDAFKTSLIGEDGKERAPTAGDFLGNIQQKAMRYMQSGYAKEAEQAMREHNAQAHIKIQMEGAERKQALGQVMAALQSGNTQAVAQFYNKYVPSGGQITSVQKTKGGGLAIEGVGLDGQPIPTRTIASERDAMAMLLALEDPSAVYQHSQNEFANMMRLRADNRSAASSARADARADRAEARESKRDAKEQAKENALTGYAKELDPSISEAKLKAIQHGILKVGGDEDGNYSFDPNKVQRAFAEIKPGMLAGEEKVIPNKQKEAEYRQFTAERGIRDDNKGLVLFNQHNAKQAQAEKQEQAKQDEVRKAAAAKVVKDMTPANLAATAKKYNMSVDEVRQELIKRGIPKN